MGSHITRWFKDQNEQLQPLQLNDRITIISAGLLKIMKARLEDSGKYLCWVNNTAGEETIQVTLTVTGKYMNIWMDIIVFYKKNKNHTNIKEWI